MYELSHVYQDCTNSVPIVKTVKNSQKTVKTAKITVAVPIVTCLRRVRRIHKAPPQPVRPWKSGHVHLAEGSNVLFVLELPFSTELGCGRAAI